MADGRMIKRVITRSKKFADLKTDKARLLWFYLLPFTDIEGRVEADPDDIREEFLRRQRKGYSVSVIQACLEDMHNVGLIVLYAVGSKQYLEYTRFHDEQTLRRDKEAETKIPDPTTGEVRDQSGVKLSKVKLSKVNINRWKLFYEPYPRKVKRDHVIEWFEKHQPSDEDIERMLNCMKLQKVPGGRLYITKATRKERMKFIPHPTTWLNDGDWKEAPTNAEIGDRSKEQAEKEKKYRASEHKKKMTLFRDDEGTWLKEKTTEELKSFLTLKNQPPLRLELIKEILAER